MYFLNLNMPSEGIKWQWQHFCSLLVQFWIAYLWVGRLCGAHLGRPKLNKTFDCVFFPWQTIGQIMELNGGAALLIFKSYLNDRNLGLVWKVLCFKSKPPATVNYTVAYPWLCHWPSVLCLVTEWFEPARGSRLLLFVDDKTLFKRRHSGRGKTGALHTFSL